MHLGRSGFYFLAADNGDNCVKTGVLILECRDKNDPGSEGSCLKRVFDLMGVKSDYVRIRTIDDLLKAIEKSRYKYIHISTHGLIRESSKDFIGWWTPEGVGEKQNISQLRNKVRCKAIISTACKSGINSFGKYVVDVLGSKYFVGPSGQPQFHNAIFFSHIFYHKLFFTKTKGHVSQAFRSYERFYKNPHKFRLFIKKA